MTGLPELDSGLPGLARHLRAEAAEAIARAQAAVAQSRQRRAARKQWQRLWSAYCRRPSTYLTCCADCQRLRTDWGDWVSIPHEISELLRHAPALNLSHGLCPECLARYAPEQLNPRPMFLVS